MDQITKLHPASAESNGELVRAVDEVSAAAHDSVDRMVGAARPAADRLAAGAHRSVDSIAAAASGAADTIGATSAQLKRTQVRVTDQCEAYVRENPWTSLGLAMAAGFLVSRLVGSRRDA